MADKPSIEKLDVLNEQNTSEETLSAFERWELPLMEDQVTGRVESNALDFPQPHSHQEADEPEIQPLTAEDVEAIRQAAYDEGLAQGKEAGYEQGYEKGYKSGESEIKAAVTRTTQIGRVLFAPIAEQDDALEAVLLELVKIICTQVVHRELCLDASGLVMVIKEAVDCLNPGSQRIKIHVNPKDAELINNELKNLGDATQQWQVLSHPTVSPGGCIVDTDKSMIDARAEKRLSRLIQQVYEKSEDALISDTTSSNELDQLIGEVETFADDVSSDDNVIVHESSPEKHTSMNKNGHSDD